jgi:seryl-tRNA synthetase
MVDIQYIRDNPERVKTKSQEKGYIVDIEELLRLDAERLALLQQVEQLRQKRNENAAAMNQAGKPEEALISSGKQIKVELAHREALLADSQKQFDTALASVPNMHFDDVPVGDESASAEIKTVGATPTGALDHLDFATKKGWLDFERGTKVAGTKFYFLKGDLALLENALIQFALKTVTEKGFVFMTVPHMVNSRIETGTGFAPRTSDQNDEYYIEGEDLALIATAEIPLTGYHADEIIDEAALPLQYAGLSACYRKEAGAYGKHTRGLFRVHQFNKLEMYAYTLPEESAAMHERILSIEEEIWQALGIPYHVINIASGDLGAPAAKKYDIEYWSQVDEKYRELTSCSNCTDYQTRNLNIRVRRKDGQVELLHSLNGTAVSTARSLIAIIEHYQTADGDLRVPDVLKPYMSGKELI